MDLSETIAASDLKGSRSRHLIEFMKVKVISLPYIFQVLYVLCFTWTRYQVSVYRTIGPLVYHCWFDLFLQTNVMLWQKNTNIRIRS